MRLADDPNRERATSFGKVADDYDRARPTYPPDAVSWLLGRDPLEVVDLGAGTGKLTAVLVGAGHRVVAVEPLDELRAKLTDALPGIPALQGSAEALPLPDASVDAVVAGQAFHWFDIGAALAEIGRVLRPGGTLGLLWNFRDDASAWMRDLAAIAGQDGLPEGWTRELEALPVVTSVERRDFRLEHRVDRERLLALLRSWSHVASQDNTGRHDLLRRVEALWDAHPQLAGAAQAVMTYRTEAYRIRIA